MTTAREWLRARRPAAPAPLDAAMLERVSGTEGEPAQVMADAGLAALRDVLARPSTRGTALDLLAADALLTHACEAAADAGREPLERLLESLSSRLHALPVSAPDAP